MSEPLLGDVPREVVATNSYYSWRHKALFGAAILMGAGLHKDNRPLQKPHGLYGAVLLELVVAPGNPADDPDRHYRCSNLRAGLLFAARNLGLHRSDPGGGVEFVGAEAFTPFIRNERVTARCQEWYDTAYGLAQQAVEASIQKKTTT